MGHPTRMMVSPTTTDPTTTPRTTSSPATMIATSPTMYGQVRQQEGDQAADEALAGEHQQDVADERERQCGHEPWSRGLARW